MSNAYLQPLTDIAIFTGTGLVFIIIVLTLSRLLSPRKKTAEKELVYESGENAEGSSWPTVSTGYFVVALLFLLFEIEIIFLVPVALHLGSAPGAIEILIAIIIFVLILAFGLAYAWVHGYLNWFSPGKNVSDFKSSVPLGLYQDFNKRIENDRHAGR
jgi:NADH-quinone oxidoreductase subunit A